LVDRTESSKWIWVETGKVEIILSAFRDADNLMEHVNVIYQQGLAPFRKIHGEKIGAVINPCGPVLHCTSSVP